ncbi:MAG: hypothetical protein ACI4RD_07935 [Kiritimatiellia bacterium]
MKTPVDKRIALTFYSHPMRDPKLRWKASLVFDPGSTDASMARLSVVDGDGEPVAGGTFEFAGALTKIRDGEGRLNCGDFAKGRHEPAIWLHRKGLVPVPGALTFE